MRDSTADAASQINSCHPELFLQRPDCSAFSLSARLSACGCRRGFGCVSSNSSDWAGLKSARTIAAVIAAPTIHAEHVYTFVKGCVIHLVRMGGFETRTYNYRAEFGCISFIWCEWAGLKPAPTTIARNRCGHRHTHHPRRTHVHIRNGVCHPSRANGRV